MKTNIKCAMFPNPNTNSTWSRESHPIILETAKELEKLGCLCLDTPESPSLFWILTNHKNIDVLHVHWPEVYYERLGRPRNRFLSRVLSLFPIFPMIQRVFGLFWLVFFLYELKILKIPLVWTLHDLFPHISQSPSKLQRYTRQYLLKHTDVLLLNCESAECLAKRELGKPLKTVVAPLGDYKVFYPKTVDRDKARQLFRLSNDETMFLFFGSQRPHRNTLELMQAFKEIPDPSIHLWVIGYTPEDIRSAIEELNWLDWRVHLHLKQVNNQQLEYAIKACDFLVMPGKNYLTSAVVALALSYGVPVIAPQYGCAGDMIKEAGILYDDTQSQGLKDALLRALDNKEALRVLAQQQMSRWSWQTTAKQTYEAYQLAINYSKTDRKVHEQDAHLRQS
jgi:beta-1,4-mannosyltransferase